MKKKKFDLLLALTVIAALALLGAAVWFAVLRPNSNWHIEPGVIALPDWRPPDCLISAFFLLSAAIACFAGGLHYDKDDGPEEGKGEEGGGAGCP